MSAPLQQDIVQKLSQVLGWDNLVVEGVVQALMEAPSRAEADKIVEVRQLAQMEFLRILLQVIDDATFVKSAFKRGICWHVMHLPAIFLNHKDGFAGIHGKF